MGPRAGRARPPSLAPVDPCMMDGARIALEGSPPWSRSEPNAWHDSRETEKGLRDRHVAMSCHVRHQRGRDASFLHLSQTPMTKSTHAER